METLVIPETARTEEHFCQLAVDLGGSFLKVAYFGTTKKDCQTIELNYYTYDQIEELINEVDGKLKDSDVIGVTGSGSTESAELKKVIEEKFPSQQVKDIDELGSIDRGSRFIMQCGGRDIYSYENSDYKIVRKGEESVDFPFLVCNVGTGVSHVKVCADGEFTLVGSDVWSGETFQGLGKLVLKTDTYDQLLELASEGDCRNVHRAIGEVPLPKVDENAVSETLDPDTMTGYYSRARRNSSRVDIAHAMLMQHAKCIGQTAALKARAQDVKHILFSGGFSRANPEFIWNIIDTVNVTSENQLKTWFTRFDRFVTVIGGLLCGEEDLNPNEKETDCGVTEETKEEPLK